ncbi:MAG: ATP-binding cassette domain-containing protein [Deltaproteobacteria bacterium]|nr:ATP-binding cassette domain-containing protein [Deltaproteobacteria bacterium]
MVLNNISLKISKGEIVAFVGASGAGKTSLIGLLPRFYDISGGSLRIDSIDIREATLHSLRKQIALVSQDIFLFNDTLYHNIAYGNIHGTVTRDDVIKAAMMAHAHDFIIQLPNGYDTIVGERGVKLSGGQRQRIAIARALIKNAPILILDEATSSLDSESELQVQRAVENLIAGRTTLVVAHRLSTIANATRIVVLQEGKVMEVGNHSDLLKREGIYNRLYRLQHVREV